MSVNTGVCQNEDEVVESYPLPSGWRVERAGHGGTYAVMLPGEVAPGGQGFGNPTRRSKTGP